jgi:pimeloyl-ACP methyl ester carboxylesterase
MTTDTSTWQEQRRAVAGVDLQVLSGGQGEPLLILHDYEYLNEWHPFEERLAGSHSVLVPSHPGFGTSDLPPLFDSIDDLAYLYLDLLDEIGPASVVGMGIGGWIAAEVAVRCSHQLRRLVLVDAVGIKVGDRLSRDITDTFVSGAREFLDVAWHDAAAGEKLMKLPGLSELQETELVAALRNRQSAALFTWNPFMHNPRLRDRLRRIAVPTLVVWGESDRIVTPEYGRAFAGSIPGARFATIAAAGHYPYLEEPDAFVAAVEAFLRE